MQLPDKYRVLYIADCGESYEMENFYADYIILPCDLCNSKHMFIAESLEHLSWSWDSIELESDAQSTI